MSPIVDPVRALRDARPSPFWLDRDDVRLAPRPPLSGDTSADLLVVGAGYTGLWAAIEAAANGLEVVVVDARSIAGGASGRCGGFINCSITHGVPNGLARWPDEMTVIRRVEDELWHDTLALLAAHGAGDVVEPTGMTLVASYPHQLDELREGVDELVSLGHAAMVLDADELRRRVRLEGGLGAMHQVSGVGICDPTRLAHALAAIAEARGATLHDATEVTRLERSGPGVRARTTSGHVVTARRVLLATNASRPLLRRLRPFVVPVYDHAIVTEPLTDAQWDAIGWQDRFGLADVGNRFHYARPTPDGRILFGGWDATHHRGSRIDDRHEQSPATHRMLVEHLVDRFPVLADVSISHAWGGPIDCTTRFTPLIRTTRDRRVGAAIGFTGLGVGASRFAALAALDLLDGRDTDRTALSMVRRLPVPFPPEPIRHPVIEFTKRSLVREDETGERGTWLRTLDRFGVGFDT